MRYPIYRDLVLDVLLRMGEEGNISGTAVTDTAVVAAYKKAIPALLRQGLVLLSTAGKYIVKSVDIVLPGGETGVIKIDMAERAEDFFSLLPAQVFYSDGKSYGHAENCSFEAGRIFRVDAGIPGTWTVYYNAYPGRLDNLTETTTLLIAPEVYALLPLFIEGKLRMIHDEDYGTAVLNEFEQRRAELRSADKYAFVTETEGI